MEGRASDPTAWPQPFRVDGSGPSSMIDLGEGHFVRARETGNHSELIA